VPYADFAAGTLPRPFGNYELLEEVARGGMGVVYKARQYSLDRLIALKMILAGPQASGTALERFTLEARAAAALDHPHIVPVYECGWHEGHPFFTMALIDGASLQQQVQADGLPDPRAAVRLLQAVVDAVAHAHAQGIVHRDLKPHNILIDRQGRPRVTDFGLARRFEEGGGLTAPGQVLGTPSYMAPEQALGDSQAMGPAVDIYALGGILYFLLTGKPPFHGATTLSILRRVVDEPPAPPRQANPLAPEGLQAICLKCLAKDPADRYPSAAALAEALADWARQADRLEDTAVREYTPPASSDTALVPPGPAASDTALLPPGPAAPPGRRPSRRGLAALVAGVATLAVAGVLLVLWATGRLNGPAPPPGGGEPAAETGPELPRTQHHDFRLQVEMSGGREGPNGRRLFRAGEQTTFRLVAERDCYVGIWSLDPDGNVTQLFPNEYERDHRVRANQALFVPGNKEYMISGNITPPGKYEAMWVVAATRRWDPLVGETDGPFVVFRTPADRDRFEKRLREVRGPRGFVIRPKTPSLPTQPEGKDDQIAEEVLTYRVEPG
jgi:hypothetical protein